MVSTQSWWMMRSRHDQPMPPACERDQAEARSDETRQTRSDHRTRNSDSRKKPNLPDVFERDACFDAHQCKILESISGNGEKRLPGSKRKLFGFLLIQLINSGQC